MPDDVSPDVDSRDVDDMADVVLAKQQQQQVPLPRPRPIPYRRFPPQPEMPIPMEPPQQPQRNLYQVWRDMIARNTHKPADTAEAIPFVPWPPAPDTFEQRFDPERANQADANFDEMKNRLQLADDMRNAGLGAFTPPNGYAEGAPAPLYRPPGGAEVVDPGAIQRLIEQGTSGMAHEDPNHVYHMFRRRQQDI
jgi:hypothetical protein